MKKSYLFLSIALIFLLILFSASKKPKVNNYQTIIPPGTMEVAINLYCDEIEATNRYWLDYLRWISEVYGVNSQEYKVAMPDTAVWKEVYSDSIAQFLGSRYLHYPAYRNYPLVGVSQQQAKEYAKWRSDRVMEQILINMGILELQVNPTKENHFTIERFFNGQIPKLKDVTIEYYPEYRLPNLQE